MKERKKEKEEGGRKEEREEGKKEGKREGRVMRLNSVCSAGWDKARKNKAAARAGVRACTQACKPTAKQRMSSGIIQDRKGKELKDRKEKERKYRKGKEWKDRKGKGEEGEGEKIRAVCFLQWMRLDEVCRLG